MNEYQNLLFWGKAKFFNLKIDLQQMAYCLDIHDLPHFQHIAPPFWHKYTVIFPSFFTIRANITVVVPFPRQPLQKDVTRLVSIPLSGYTHVEENFLFYFLRQTYDNLSYLFPSKTAAILQWIQNALAV
jgi:hypothetical protein